MKVPLLFSLAIIFVAGFNSYSHSTPYEGEALSFQQQSTENYWKQNKSIAVSLSKMTGVALNPLLIGAGLGAYMYLSAPQEKRSELPWYCTPWFLIISFCLVGIPFFTSLFGVALNLPTPISTLLEGNNKALGVLVSTPMVLSLIDSMAGPVTAGIQAALSVNNDFLCATLIPLDWLSEVPLHIWEIVVKVMLFFVFIAVWFLNFSFDVFIFLCPFGWIKGALGTIRGSIYSALTALSLRSPSLSFIVTLPIIIISVMLFAWSVRRVAMGIVLVRDFIGRKKDVPINYKGVVVFSDSGLNMPTKRMGMLVERRGQWVFTFKRFFIFRKTVYIKKGEPILRKGVMFSSILEKGKPIFMLALRYQKNVERVQTCLKIEKIEYTKLKRGLKSIMAWIKETFAGKSIGLDPGVNRY